MTDDQTLEQLRYMPGVRGHLGSNGTTFQRAFASYPKCCPSRATALTGQYAHNHGVLGNGGPFGGVENFDHSRMLPVWLHNAGYRTVHVGHWLAGYGGEHRVSGRIVPPGFDEWHASLDPGSWNYRTWQMSHNGAINTVDGHYQTDYYTRLAVKLIETEAPKPGPFYLQVWYAAPHTGQPRDPGDSTVLGSASAAPRDRGAHAATRLPLDPSYDERDVSDKPRAIASRPRLTPEWHAAVDSARRQALDSLLSVDDSVAAVVEALKRTGDLERTLIVFTSDNGFMTGQHRIAAEKTVPYEPSVRVPLVLRGPGVPRRKRDRRLVANIDLAPTILDAAEVAPGLTQDGRSLLPMLADPGRESGRDILLENGRGTRWVDPYRGIRTYRYSYVEWPRTDELELYDLRRDPYQLRNVAQRRSYALVRRTLRARLRALARCRGRDCRLPPRVRLKGRARGRRAACSVGPVRLRLSGAEVRAVTRMDVLLGRRVLSRRRRAPFVTRVARSRLPAGRSRLRARVRFRDGRVLTLDRRFNICG